jgi:hypothetical protein
MSKSNLVAKHPSLLFMNCRNILPLAFSERGLAPIQVAISVLELTNQAMDGLLNPGGKIDEAS